jgi:hypothetical protein
MAQTTDARAGAGESTPAPASPNPKLAVWFTPDDIRTSKEGADLIAGLDRYIRAATHEDAIALWIVWAAGLGADEHQPASDGSEWHINTRWEAR